MKRYFLFSIMAILACISASQSVAQNIYTFAGIAGTNGYTGDDSLATVAELSGPSGIACAAGGAVIFADSRNNVVRSVGSSGIITTIAGKGTAGFTGDGGAATAAQLRGANGVALDASGNLYIADTRNNVIRKVDALGIITTVAGTGTGGYAGDGGAATAALLRGPVGVAVDGAGNVYFSDSRNQVVRKVTTSGIIFTVAGNNTPGYTGDTSPATAAQLSNPLGIAITSAGNLYIADARNNVIRIVNSAGVINTFAGSGLYGHSGDGGAATAASFEATADVKVDASGNVFIADSSNTVRVVNTSGIVSGYAGTGVAGYSGDGGAATAAKMSGPVGLAIDASHNVYIATQGNNVIRRVGASVAGIRITSNAGDTLCMGHFSSFTATPVADASPHYQWQQNGVNVGTDNALYTPGSLATGDLIKCILLTAPGGTPLAISNNMRVDSMPRPGVINGPATFCIGSAGNVTSVGSLPPGSGTWVSGNTAVATIAPTGRVTGVATGVTTIYYILTDNCGTDSAMHAIAVVPNTIGAITGPTDVCAGAAVSYADTTASGKWRVRPAGPFGTIDSVTGAFTAGFISGRTVITYATSGGCSRADTITIDSLPVNGSITGPVTVVAGNSITLANSVAGGKWSSSDMTTATVDASTGIVSGIIPGTATITYTITNTAGCSADTAALITVLMGSSVNNISAAGGIDIFPNPAKGSMTIRSEGFGNEHVKVVIADLSGRRVFTKDIVMNGSVGATALDISALQPGVYLLSAASGKQFYSKKLVIEE